MQSVPPPVLLAPSRRQRSEVEPSNSIVDRHQGRDGVNNGSAPEDDGAVEQMYVRTIAPEVRLNDQENQAKRVPDRHRLSKRTRQQAECLRLCRFIELPDCWIYEP